jgi:hypothetical protein
LEKHGGFTLNGPRSHPHRHSLDLQGGLAWQHCSAALGEALDALDFELDHQWSGVAGVFEGMEAFGDPAESNKDSETS